jgi:hypothetical protein
VAVKLINGRGVSVSQTFAGPGYVLDGPAQLGEGICGRPGAGLSEAMGRQMKSEQAKISRPIVAVCIRMFLLMIS